VWIVLPQSNSARVDMHDVSSHQFLSGTQSLVQAKHQARQTTIGASGDHRRMAGMAWLAIWLGLGSALLCRWTTAERVSEGCPSSLLRRRCSRRTWVSCEVDVGETCCREKDWGLWSLKSKLRIISRRLGLGLKYLEIPLRHELLQSLIKTLVSALGVSCTELHALSSLITLPTSMHSRARCTRRTPFLHFSLNRPSPSLSQQPPTTLSPS
jgi:hypothetical protein